MLCFRYVLQAKTREQRKVRSVCVYLRRTSHRRRIFSPFITSSSSFRVTLSFARSPSPSQSLSCACQRRNSRRDTWEKIISSQLSILQLRCKVISAVTQSEAITSLFGLDVLPIYLYNHWLLFKILLHNQGLILDYSMFRKYC